MTDTTPPDARIGAAAGRWFALLLGRQASVPSPRSLPDDPMQLLGRTSTHWAGNINVLIGQHAVERHMAQALRIYPGMTNLACFFVGAQRDEYRFAVTGSGATGDATLYDLTGVHSPTATPMGVIPQSQWVWIGGCHLILLALSVPSHCTSGSVDVHVCQRSTNREAVVEFSLDANAAGAGCYTV
jgi:hypothetical protein